MAETKKTKENKMKTVILEKVTVNVCVGNDKQGMVKAEKLLKKLTEKTPVKNAAKKRLAAWQIRPGLPIGYKVTLRGVEASKFLQWILDSKGKKFNASSLDQNSNFSIGFHEYLDLNGMKYDADIGIMGFEVMATFVRPGFRIKSRRLNVAKVPLRHRVTNNEVLDFMKSNFGVKVE
ncbi:MAG: 50S ribosomal protein L5 [Nanoarchaeota archaeon]|nr:50S ribosomal protein L5 [Nanoarchaeota archaeon]